MKTYEFSIIASGLDEAADDFEGRFYDNGCDDATVSFQKGNIILDFAREAESLNSAIESAIADVRRAGAKVERVEPDPLVSLTDIATRSGISKAAVSLYVANKRGEGFPSPCARVTTSTPLWQWSVVARWMVFRGVVSGSVLDDAVTLQRVNAHLELEAA
ncbi:hypothetical protein AAC691_12920 [Nguyenibacter vanlangensis]|uniref:DNA-binding protein n=1 Tax=Nguyenibacter vanlangensis TaxID=1216886 RepID=A0ABZ3D0D0_9PROT